MRSKKRTREKPFSAPIPKDRRKLNAFAVKLYRKTGVRVLKDLRKTPKGSELRKVSAAWKKYGNYLNPKHRFQFVKLDKARLKRVGEKVEPNAKLESGIFVQRPKAKGMRVRVMEDGEIRIGNSKRTNVIAELDAEKLADDPAQAVKDAMKGKKRPSQVLLRVNGYQFRRDPMNVRDFYAYMVNDLLPRVMNHPKHAMTEEQIAEVFTLELVYFKKKRK